MNDGIEVEVKELLENDYHCLWKTFEWAKKELNLPEESHFSYLTNDLKNLKEDLSSLIFKWSFYFTKDFTHTRKLMD